MAKSSGKVIDGEIREGLLCPVCLCDLKTEVQLLEHFELAHSEDHAVVQTLKGFLGKAKRKFLRQDVSFTEDEERSSEPFAFVSFPSDFSSEPFQNQEIGAKNNHTQYFKKLRDKKIDRYVIETNKLLIRLDKLILLISDDPERKKEIEKNIVPWVPDSDVPLCPGCAKSFGLSRRRHHCRLCGGVMCHSCSFFINYEFARKLTDPVTSCDSHLLGKPNASSRRQSNSSLMSVVNLSSAEPLIRICKDCNLLLVRQENLVEQRNYRPVVVQIYEKLKDCMNETEKLVLIYLEKIDSLNSGETSCSLQDVQDLKVKISKLAERIDHLSKRVTKLESAEESSSRELQLHNGIRMAASQFLRTAVLGLPSAPTQEEILQLQKMHKDQVQKRIQQEKQAEIVSQSKKETSKSNSVHTSPKRQAVSPDTGWCPASPSPRNVQDVDPMLQQIEIIHKYIEQARVHEKYDEVQMLEANLKELREDNNRRRQTEAS